MDTITFLPKQNNILYCKRDQKMDSMFTSLLFGHSHAHHASTHNPK